MYLHRILLLLHCLFALSASPAFAAAPWFDRTFVHIYGSQLANMEMGDFLWAQRNLTKMQPEFMLTVGGGAEKNLGGGFALGFEGNVSLHTGEEEPVFTEFSLGLTLRYYLPWGPTVLPSIAVGDGLSFTSIVPDYERRFGTGDPQKPMDSPWLNFLFVELEVLRVDQLSLFYRVHHRCTIFGLIGDSGLPGGINFHSVGLRYTF